MTAKKEQLLALVQAHAKGDNEQFRRVATQIAVQYKDGQTRDQIRRLVERDPDLPREASGAWQPAEPCPERPWYPAVVAENMNEVLTMVRYRVELAAEGVMPLTRLLLSGPPGCGKTMTARWLAAKLQMSCHVLSLGGTISSYMGQTSAKLAAALKCIAGVPAVWIIDELDAVGSVRSGDSATDKERALVVNSLCIELDRLGVLSGLLVTTTNRRDVLDPAIERRFDEIVEWPKPTAEDLTEFASHLFGGRRDAPERIGLPDTYAETYNAVQRELRRQAVRKVTA